jgi:hypothetical protein
MSRFSRRLARMAGYAFFALVLLFVFAVSLTVGWRPLIGPSRRAVTSRRFEPTPARLQRGQYLVENVALCFGCHTRFDAKGKQVAELL